MTKYLLTFYKKGNMRFISHLDLNRLFRRCIKIAEIDVVFSNGYNPHERISIVQPLSLGLESEKEYFEITTYTDYDSNYLMESLNLSLPEGIKFTKCKKTEITNNLSNTTSAAMYEVLITDLSIYNLIDLDSYLKQDKIFIQKRDKKTKQNVQKEIKNQIYELKKSKLSDDGFTISFIIKCATNETLNPINLLNSILDYSKCEYNTDLFLIKRVDMFSYSSDGNFVSLIDSAK